MSRARLVQEFSKLRLSVFVAAVQVCDQCGYRDRFGPGWLRAEPWPQLVCFHCDRPFPMQAAVPQPDPGQ